MITHFFIGHHYDIICGKRLVLPKQSPNALLLWRQPGKGRSSMTIQAARSASIWCHSSSSMNSA